MMIINIEVNKEKKANLHTIFTLSYKLFTQVTDWLWRIEFLPTPGVVTLWATCRRVRKPLGLGV